MDEFPKADPSFAHVNRRAFLLAASGMGLGALLTGCGGSEGSPFFYNQNAGPSGGGGVSTQRIGPASPSDPANLIDGGVSVRQQFTAAAGGTMPLPDGARLEIPPGALQNDVEIQIVIRTGQSSATAHLLYIFQPGGLQFNLPVRFSPAAQSLLDGQFTTFFVSSQSNTVRDLGSERTNWEDIEVGPDGAILLEHFSVIYGMVSVDANACLVTDIPGKYLLPGDLLFMLTGGNGGEGGAWGPGHVGKPLAFGTDLVTLHDGVQFISGQGIAPLGMASLSGLSFLNVYEIQINDSGLGVIAFHAAPTALFETALALYQHPREDIPNATCTVLRPFASGRKQEFPAINNRGDYAYIETVSTPSTVGRR